MARLYRSRIPMNDKHRKFDCTYGEVMPIMAKWVLPGDIWKIRAGALIRYKKMLSPTLTKSDAFFRFFFVPFRLVVDKFEEIVTGSKNGSLIEEALPVCEDFVQEFKRLFPTLKCIIRKNSFWAFLGLHPNHVTQESNEYQGNTRYDAYFNNYDDLAGMEGVAAAYWYKAYCRIIWDYFRDENYQSFDGDFDAFYKYMLSSYGANHSLSNQPVIDNGWYFSNAQYRALQHDSQPYKYMDANNNVKDGDWVDGEDYFKLWFCDLRKDYFTSSLPWIMKGVQPTINSVMHADFTAAVNSSSSAVMGDVVALGRTSKTIGAGPISNGDVTNSGNSQLLSALNKNVISDGGFTAQDIRDMFAETRIFERMARCGSRYVEYLDSNFHIAPADETLQRPQYLGGFSQPIVTTEVIQTGGDDDAIGTLRGHGISSASNKIKSYLAKEFGMIFGLMYVTPQTEYSYQQKRELGYKKRFDFFNPSLQLLSEQQVFKYEMYMPETWGTLTYTSGVPSSWTKNISSNGVFGYQGMYNELRYDNNMVLRSIADTESYWTQAINPVEISTNRNQPRNTSDNSHNTLSLNGVNLCIGHWLPSLLRPFESVDPSFKPMIVDASWTAEVFRPMVHDPIPGLVDHN